MLVCSTKNAVPCGTAFFGTAKSAKWAVVDWWAERGGGNGNDEKGSICAALFLIHLLFKNKTKTKKSRV